MGVADRGYMRGRAPGDVPFGSSWTLRAIVLLAIVFVATRGAAGWFGWRGEASLWLTRESIEEGRVWTLLTSALLHADAWHLIVNAIGLWFFGRLAESELGGTRYAVFLLLAAVVSHVPFLAAEYATGEGAATVGASGVVMAVLVFAAFRFPSLPFVFFVFPAKLWQIAALYVLLDVAGLSQTSGVTDHWTHLGGAAFGFVVHRWGLFPRFHLPRRAATSSGRERGPYAAGNVQRDVDRILDKINAQGIGALTEEEREFLKRNSDRYVS